MENTDVQQFYQETVAPNDVVIGDDSDLQKKNAFSDSATNSNGNNGSFECNICLDGARNPVVTLCGHLYCWPCIYKWLQAQSTSVDLDNPQKQHQQQCPVCKADISGTKLVPLYGRGGDISLDTEPNNKDPSDMKIPSRPPANGAQALTETTPNQQVNSRANSLRSRLRPDRIHTPSFPPTSLASPSYNLGGTTPHPMIWMFGEMVSPRVSGNSTEVNLIAYPNSYAQLTASSPRVRRQEIKAEKSLSRISIFLFCCVVLCFFLF